jgi:hypothetical protein
MVVTNAAHTLLISVLINYKTNIRNNPRFVELKMLFLFLVLLLLMFPFAL